MTKFVVDKNDVVHTGYCNVKGDFCVPYVATRMGQNEAGKPALVVVTDYREMANHLTSPDKSGGSSGWASHQGPARLTPCAMCIPNEENASAAQN